MKVAIFSAQEFEIPFIHAANQEGYPLSIFKNYLSPATAKLAEGHQVVSLFVNDDASAQVLESLAEGGVAYIALRSAGYNHVDLPKAKQLSIRVANVPEYSPYAVAEHTIALMLTLNRKIIKAHSRVRDLNFSLNGLTGFDMNGKTVGIIGTGRIGGVVAKILNGFGCQLLGFDHYPNQQLESDLGLQYTSLEDLCKRSDIITLHVPLNRFTKYIINKDLIQLMKDNVMLINTSRGGLIHTKAVIDALKTRKIGYLGLDVYEEEKGLFFEDHSADILQDDTIARLLTFNNVLITSHQGFLTQSALQNIADTTFYNIQQWHKGLHTDYELSV